MPTSEEVKQQILNHSMAPRILEEAGEFMAREREARERFYDEVQPGQKAEFILGEVIVHSPARSSHVEVVIGLTHLLRDFVLFRGLGRVCGENALVPLTRNDFEPDVCFYRQEIAQSIGRDQMKFPIPDLVIEVLSPSTEHRDRGVKFDDYQAHGIPEYWIINPDAETIEQYTLQAGKYVEVSTDEGVIRSVAVEGLELPVRAVFDPGAQMAFLRQIREA